MLAVERLRPNPIAVALAMDPPNLDPCGTSIRPRMLTGAIIVASIGSPGWEIREPVALDSRASKAVPAANSSADIGKYNRIIEQARKQNSRKTTARIVCECKSFPTGFYIPV